MKRWHEDARVTYRQWKIHQRHHYECDCEMGRFRKKDALDCGRSHCSICHSDKFPKRQLSYKEEIALVACKEQMKECRSSNRQDV